MKNIILVVLAVCSSIVCFAEKPIKTKSNESVIFGRFILDNASEVKHEKIELQFLRVPKGTAKVKVSKDGFFCLKMKAGDNIADFVDYKDGGTLRKILTNNCLSFSFKETGKVFYVGDIFMKWTPTDRDKLQKGFSLGIGMGTGIVGGAFSIPISESYTPNEDCPEITIKEMPETIDQFYKMYPDDNREVIIQFMDLY